MGRAIARPWPARWPTGLAVRLGALSRLDALALAAVCVPAAMVRLPNLAAIPVFTDEAEEIGLGLAILRDGLRPLTDVDPYIGPLWNYLLAGVFWLVSPSLVVPRVLMLVAGTVTVGFAYALGRTLHGRAVGALGAALLAASPVHIGVNSHVAWSNCLTPLFTTPALWLTALAVRDARPRLLAPAGLLFGLALHTHPSSAPILAGAALAVTATSGWMLRGRWPYVATLAGVAMNANLVVYNLLSGGRSFTYAQEIQQDYVREVGRSVGYAERFGDLIVGLLRALGGAVDTRAGVTQYLRDPLVLAAAALTLAGLVLAIRKRTWLPIVVFAATILLLPLANPKYEPILNGRYLAPILPLVLLWIGLALASLAGPARGAHPLALRSALVPSPKLGGGNKCASQG
ncbi:MAG TPA: glycosyltransferase family 39 protein, partial [Chloroflexota bacterium]|nr:glycosyltransferase family 39 protein [Chloroflexota bacterium]